MKLTSWDNLKLRQVNRESADVSFLDFGYWIDRYKKTKSKGFKRFIRAGLIGHGFDCDYSPVDEGMGMEARYDITK